MPTSAKKDESLAGKPTKDLVVKEIVKLDEPK